MKTGSPPYRGKAALVSQGDTHMAQNHVSPQIITLSERRLTPPKQTCILYDSLCVKFYTFKSNLWWKNHQNCACFWVGEEGLDGKGCGGNVLCQWRCSPASWVSSSTQLGPGSFARGRNTETLRSLIPGDWLGMGFLRNPFCTLSVCFNDLLLQSHLCQNSKWFKAARLSRIIWSGTQRSCSTWGQLGSSGPEVSWQGQWGFVHTSAPSHATRSVWPGRACWLGGGQTSW